MRGRREELAMLRASEPLHGLEVERVDAQALEVVLSLPGLSDIVAGRRFLELGDLKVGDIVDGVMILPLKWGGAIVDIGARVDALLVGSSNVTKLLYKGDEVKGMEVTDVEPESDKVALFLRELGDDNAAVAARAITSKQLKIGSVISRGRVVDRQPVGVWIDIHSDRWAFLDEPPEVAFKLKFMEEVSDIVVEGVNRNTGVADVKIRHLARKMEGRPEPMVLPAAKRRWERANKIDRWGTSGPSAAY